MSVLSPSADGSLLTSLQISDAVKKKPIQSLSAALLIIAIGFGIRNEVESQQAADLEDRQRTAISQVVVDRASLEDNILIVSLYNPTSTPVEHAVIYHVVIHDPYLKTTFDRKNLVHMEVSAMAPAQEMIDLGLHFDQGLSTKVTVEVP